MSKILVIDDEQLLRSTVVTMLTRAGFSMEEASDGKADIELIKELKRSCPKAKIRRYDEGRTNAHDGACLSGDTSRCR